MSFILEGLYLGSLEDATNTEQLRSNGVTHILSLDISPLASRVYEGFAYKHVHMLDTEDYDLLGKLTDCLQYIEEGRQQGGVLVHCVAGQSRSAAVVLAYLMHKLSLGLDEAREMLTCLRPVCRPNAGFLEQLSLFEAMGSRVDPSNQLYKQYRLRMLAQLVTSANQFSRELREQLGTDPSLGTSADQAYYRCRKCRRPLFRHSAALSHTEGPGHNTPGYSVPQNPSGPMGEGPNNTAKTGGTQCTRSLFVEPVQWMEEDIMQISGKIACPKCSAKLGSFIWSGERCSCGEWVTPAFHIPLSKVDLVRPLATQMRTSHPPPRRRAPVSQPTPENRTSV